MRMSSLLIMLSVFGGEFMKYCNYEFFDIPQEQETRERKYPRVAVKNNQIYNRREEIRNLGISVKRM